MKIKKILLILFLCASCYIATISRLSAQGNINSPYTRFGIGELSPQNNLRSSAMGGVSQGLANTYEINFANPAAYSSFDSLSFLFDFGFSGKFNTIKSSTENAKTTTASIEYITIGMPIFKWWHSVLGLTPVSSVGYDIFDETEFEGAGRVRHIFSGEGANNKFFWGNSFKPTKNLSIGLNAGYMFGNSSYARIVYFPDSTAIRTTKITNELFVSGFTFEPGIQYYWQFSPKDKFIIGATYNIQKTIKAENEMLVASMFGGDGNNNGSYSDIIESDTIQGNLKIPSSLNIGFSYQRDKKLLIGADFNWTNWSKYEILDVNNNLPNSWGVNIGAEYLPDNKPAAKYGQKIAYRLGWKTQQNILEIKDHKINQYAITAGMGFPLTRSRTAINVYFEYGTKGTRSDGLIKENYFKIGAGLSLHELWFYKRQYR